MLDYVDRSRMALEKLKLSTRPRIPVRRSESGQTMVEYSLIAALIAIACIVVLSGLATPVWCAIIKAGYHIGYAIGGDIPDVDGDGDGDNLDLFRIRNCIR